ncbi:MAG: hypothetical protein AAFY65_10870 [Pseudomonadota bacterium]
MIQKRSMTLVVEEVWGPEVPDWVRALALGCDQSSQAKMANQIGVSTSVISQTLRQTYPGSYGNVEEAVRGALMNVTVSCPRLGSLSLNDCRKWRKRADKYDARNTLSARMFRACNRCPIKTSEKET